MLEERALLAEMAGPSLDLVEDDTSDFRAEDVVVALVFGQFLSQADFRQTGAIERRCVEIARARLPGSVDCHGRFFIRNVAEHVSQRRGAKAERPVREIFSDTHRVLRGWGLTRERNTLRLIKLRVAGYPQEARFSLEASRPPGRCRSSLVLLPEAPARQRPRSLATRTSTSPGGRGARRSRCGSNNRSKYPARYADRNHHLAW